MSQSRGRDLKPLVDGMFYEIFRYGTFFRYHNFQNEIDAWESTVPWYILCIQFNCTPSRSTYDFEVPVRYSRPGIPHFNQMLFFY